MMFPNIFLGMVVWCFGRDTDMFRGNGSLQNAIMLQLFLPGVVHHFQEQYSLKLSRLKRSMRSWLRLRRAP